MSVGIVSAAKTPIIPNVISTSASVNAAILRVSFSPPLLFSDFRTLKSKTVLPLQWGEDLQGFRTLASANPLQYAMNPHFCLCERIVKQSSQFEFLFICIILFLLFLFMVINFIKKFFLHYIV